MNQGLIWIIEKAFFVTLYTILLVILLALIFRVNSSAFRTKLVLPLYARIGLIIEVILIAGSIILVLLNR